jgi:hypothetical protein
MTSSKIELVLEHALGLPDNLTDMAYAQAAYFYALLGKHGDSLRCAEQVSPLPDEEQKIHILMSGYLADAAYFRGESQERGDLTIEGLHEGSSRQRNWNFLQERFEGRSLQSLVIDEENSALFGNIKHMVRIGALGDPVFFYEFIEQRDLHAGNNQEIIDLFHEITEDKSRPPLTTLFPAVVKLIHQKCLGKEIPSIVDELVDLIRAKQYNEKIYSTFRWLAIAIDAIFQKKTFPDFPDRMNFLDRLEACTYLLFVVRGQSVSEETLNILVPGMFNWGCKYRYSYDLIIILMLDNLFTVLALEEQQQSKG